jgi:VPDSG-CTERM motif
MTSRLAAPAHCVALAQRSKKLAKFRALHFYRSNPRKSKNTIMKLSKSLLGILAAALAVARFLPSVQAQEFTHPVFQIAYASGLNVGDGIVNITNGTATFNTPSLATATMVTAFSNTAVVGMGNTGVFSSITPGTPVTMTAPLILNQPEQSPSMLFSVSGFTVDVTGTMTMEQNAQFLEVSGTGTLTGHGMNQAPGSFTFTATAPDSGTTLGLLGIGLMGILAVRRKLGQA